MVNEMWFILFICALAIMAFSLKMPTKEK